MTKAKAEVRLRDVSTVIQCGTLLAGLYLNSRRKSFPNCEQVGAIMSPAWLLPVPLICLVGWGVVMRRRPDGWWFLGSMIACLVLGLVFWGFERACAKAVPANKQSVALERQWQLLVPAAHLIAQGTGALTPWRRPGPSDGSRDDVSGRRISHDEQPRGRAEGEPVVSGGQ
jgi:hypothetical protein